MAMRKLEETVKTNMARNNVLWQADVFNELVAMCDRSPRFGWAKMDVCNIVGNRGECLRGRMV